MEFLQKLWAKITGAFVSDVLRERLEQAKDQITKLEGEKSELQSKIVILETEKKTLTEENTKLKIQVENRRKMSEYRPIMF